MPVVNFRPSRRVAALALAAIGVGGISAASASQLALSGRTVQAGVGVVATCQPSAQPITVSLASAYDATAAAYRTSSVTFANVASACNGSDYSVQLLDGSGNLIDSSTGSGLTATGTVTLASGSFTVAVPSSTPTASIASVALALTD